MYIFTMYISVCPDPIPDPGSQVRITSALRNTIGSIITFTCDDLFYLNITEVRYEFCVYK